LDIAAADRLLDALRRLAAEKPYTVVVVTHELNLAAEYADQVVLRLKSPIRLSEHEVRGECDLRRGAAGLGVNEKNFRQLRSSSKQ